MRCVFFVECAADDPHEFLPKRICHELLDVHDRSIVFAAEPSATLPLFGTSEVARVASWHLSTSAIVLPQTILEERLRELHLRILAVGRQSNGHWGTEQPSSVDDTEKGYLLLPDFDHCIIESSDIFLSLFNGLLLGDLLRHDAKVEQHKMIRKDSKA